MHHIYICSKKFQIDTLKIQKEEVAEIKTIKLEHLIHKVSKGKNNFVPHGKDYYSFVFSELKKLYIWDYFIFYNKWFLKRTYQTL